MNALKKHPLSDFDTLYWHDWFAGVERVQAMSLGELVEFIESFEINWKWKKYTSIAMPLALDKYKEQSAALWACMEKCLSNLPPEKLEEFGIYAAFEAKRTRWK